jgi:NADH-quinone oxidoreductase subunit C
MTMATTESSVAALRDKLGDRLQSVEEFRGQTTVAIDRGAIQIACRTLHDDPGLQFDLLAALTAVDYWPQEPRFSVIYQMYSVPRNLFLRLRVPLRSQSPELASIESIYPNANWHEREIYDMFGITFTGHSDLRRILMPADWVGHPLRKDHPLGYEEVQFTFNYDEIDRRKPYAKS